MRFVMAVLGVGIIHFFVSFMVGFMAGTQNGFWRILSNILSFPLSLLPPNWLSSGATGWVLWGLTSLAWGWGICAVFRHFFWMARPGN